MAVIKIVPMPGAKGDQGDQGPIGPQGEIGPVGPAGPAAEPALYVPTWSGDGLVYTGAPAFGSYIKNGTMVFVQISVDMTNVTNFGSGQYSITLPFTSRWHTDVYGGSIHDTSGNDHYSIKGHLNSNSDVATLWYVSGSSKDEPFIHNAPINLTASDLFHMSFVYESEE